MRRLVLVCVIAGCSWGMQSAPDVDPGTRPVPCSQSRAAPVADTVGAVIVGVVAAGAGLLVTAIGSNSQESQGTRNTTFVLGGIAVAVYAVSAYHGFDTAARCERYNAKPSAAR